MMYAERLAIAVKTNGKILREHGDKVFLPFGCEYSLVIKNTHNRRALVSIEIDGTDVTGGTQLVVGANSTLEFERFIQNGNLSSGHRFKFIERTAKIEDGPRGAKIDDGLIRVEFEFEQPFVKYQPTYDSFLTTKSPSVFRSSPLYNDLVSTQCSTQSFAAASNSSSTAKSLSMNDVGITVGGSMSDQKFHNITCYGDGVKHSMVLHLVGEIEGRIIKTPVMVSTKIRCSTCGHMNKSSTKFCPECGTAVDFVS